jgi:hypothetical protein
MPGPAGALDDALEQALQAQLARHAYLDGWRCRYAPVTGADAPASVNTVAVAPSAAQAETDGASRGTVQTRVGAISAAAADGAVQTTEPRPGARPKPVPPRSGEQREAALALARQQNTELAGLRTGLQSGELTLAELLALAQSGHAAGRMLVRTALLALPGIRTARASQLMTQAGVGDGCRTGSLTAGQRERLVAAVNPELAAAVASTTPAARQQVGQASPGNTKTTTPENTGDDWGQIVRDRDLGVGEAVKAALLEQAAREQPLGHRAIGRQLGVSGTTIDSYCRKLMQTGVHYAECPHRFTEAGRKAPGRKPAVAHPAST